MGGVSLGRGGGTALAVTSTTSTSSTTTSSTNTLPRIVRRAGPRLRSVLTFAPEAWRKRIGRRGNGDKPGDCMSRWTPALAVYLSVSPRDGQM